jgi:hypothetical protein
MTSIRETAQHTTTSCNREQTLCKCETLLQKAGLNGRPRQPYACRGTRDPRGMGAEMQFRKSMLFAGALLAGGTPAFGANLKTPHIASYDVACAVVNGQPHTVKFNIQFQNFGMLIYRFQFKNTATGQVHDYPASGQAQGDVSFPVPSGSYEASVTLIPALSSPPVANAARVVFPAITVPQVAVTPGTGTGCVFAVGPVLQDVPALKR